MNAVPQLLFDALSLGGIYAMAALGIAPQPTKFLDAIDAAKGANLIDWHEEKWLKHMNKAANEAKHNGSLPF